MEYRRVIPRDLFNEAKLLKCLGRLALKIHDGVPWPLTADLGDDEGGFRVGQDDSDGSIYCLNLSFFMRSINPEEFLVYTPLNSKDNYPLMFNYDDGTWHGRVFDESGEFSAEFVEFMEKCSVNG